MYCFTNYPSKLISIPSICTDCTTLFRSQAGIPLNYFRAVCNVSIIKVDGMFSMFYETHEKELVEFRVQCDFHYDYCEIGCYVCWLVGVSKNKLWDPAKSSIHRFGLLIEWMTAHWTRNEVQNLQPVSNQSIHRFSIQRSAVVGDWLGQTVKTSITNRDRRQRLILLNANDCENNQYCSCVNCNECALVCVVLGSFYRAFSDENIKTPPKKITFVY